jgi:outer membrane protein OmpA-like peptidoglycan-associated protein
MRAQYAAGAEQPKRNARAWVVLSAFGALIAAAIVVSVRNSARWNEFVRELQVQPGIVVTHAERPWFGAPRLSGLRDATAPADPAVIARETGVNPERVQFQWEDFLALDAASVQRRFTQRFDVPNGTNVTVDGGVVGIAGSVPYEWLEHVKREATLVPGVRAVAADAAQVQVTYDPQLAQQRFEQQLGVPEGVRVSVTDGVLKVSGEASHHWLTRIRATATTLPGIQSLDDRQVIDLDERTFQQSKTVIENAFVYFLVNKDNIATEGFAALSRLPEELRRCVTAAQRLGRNVLLEIRGYADPVGNEMLNLDLSRRRAERVREFLIQCGFDPAMLHPVPMGTHGAGAPGAEPLPDDAERRVEFTISSFPASP